MVVNFLMMGDCVSPVYERGEGVEWGVVVRGREEVLASGGVGELEGGRVKVRSAPTKVRVGLSGPVA